MGKRSKGKNGKQCRVIEKTKKPQPSLPLGSPATLRELCSKGVYESKNLESEIDKISRLLGSRLEYTGKEHMSTCRAYIWKVLRPSALRFHDSTPVTLWHGSSVRNFSNILLQRLEPGRSSCMFGRAIYLGGLSKALCYSGTTGILLRCKVCLGKVYEATTSLKGCPPGFDTVMGMRGKTESWRGHLIHDEWAIYDPGRVSVQEVYVLSEFPSRM